MTDATIEGVGLALLAAYFLPTIIGIIRRIHWGGVFVLNLLLGWTLLGWIAALTLACGSRPR